MVQHMVIILLLKNKLKNLKDNLNVSEKILKIYMTFSVLIKIQLDNGKTVTYKLKFIDSFRFMLASFSILANNLSEGLDNDKCMECKSYLYYVSINDDQLTLRFFKSKKKLWKRFQQSFNK